MRYIGPFDNPNGPYVNGNPDAGIEGSIADFRSVEHPMRELVSLVERAGVDVPAEADLEQVLKAVRSGRLNYVVATGSANAVSVAFTPVHTAYIDGLELTIKALQNNTGPVMLTLDALGAREIVYQNGVSLYANELEAGRLFRARYDAAISKWVLGSPPLQLGSTFVGDNRGATPDIAQAAGPSENNTIIGEVTLPVGHVNAQVNGTMYIDGNTTSAAQFSLDIYSNANDGTGWQRIEWTFVTKPSGYVLTGITRSALRNLDRAKSYTFRITSFKDASTGAATGPRGSLQVIGFKL